VKSDDILRAMSGIGDDLIREAGQKLARNDPDVLLHLETEEAMNTKTIRNTRRTILIAAALAALLAVTALAVGLFRTSAVPVETGEGLSGTWFKQEFTYPDAGMYLTFESDSPRHEAYFKAGWLPTAPTTQWHGDSGDDFLACLADEGAEKELPYTINSFNKSRVNGVRYTLNGQAELVLQDEWRGLERTEIAVDYTRSESVGFDSANYIILFDEENNYLIQIAGTSDMATLEKIADNLEIRVGGVAEVLEAEGDIDMAWFDLGRG